MLKIYVYIIKIYKFHTKFFYYSDVQLYNFMSHLGCDLYPLLPSLFDLFDYIPSGGIWDSIIKYHWKECLDYLENNSELPAESLPTVPNNIQVINKYAFGILDEYVWKIKFENKLDINFLLKDSN